MGIKVKRVLKEDQNQLSNKDPLACHSFTAQTQGVGASNTVKANSETEKIIQKLSKPGVRIVKVEQVEKSPAVVDKPIPIVKVHKEQLDCVKESTASDESDEDYVPEKRVLHKTATPKKKPPRQSTFMTVKKTSYVCVMCGESFPSLDTLSEHMRSLVSCRRESSVICPICEKSFKNRSRCNAHLNTHKEKPKYPCKKCGKEFSNTIALQAHLETMHTQYFDATADAFACKLCDKQAPKKQLIMYHINTSHMHVSTFLCDICGKSFWKESSLRAHNFTHSDTKPFMCQICSKSFKLQSSLRAHINTHNQERRFICEECGKTFKKNSTLIEHKKHHLGEFPFRCDICDKKFVSRSAQNTHMKSHTYAVLS